MANKYVNTYQLNKNDEYYTPDYIIKPLLKHLPKKKLTIWCPFDTKESGYVRLLKEMGHKVIYSHLSTGQDFLVYKPKKKYDMIITNPAFTIKFDVFRRLFEINKPFAILMGMQICHYGTMNQLFLEHNYKPEILTFTARPKLDGNPSAFMNGYYTKGILPSHYEVEVISNKDYEHSKMHENTKLKKWLKDKGV